jgi:hypothetical protein
VERRGADQNTWAGGIGRITECEGGLEDTAGYVPLTNMEAEEGTQPGSIFEGYGL